MASIELQHDQELRIHFDEDPADRKAAGNFLALLDSPAPSTRSATPASTAEQLTNLDHVTRRESKAQPLVDHQGAVYIRSPEAVEFGFQLITFFMVLICSAAGLSLLVKPIANSIKSTKTSKWPTWFAVLKDDKIFRDNFIGGQFEKDNKKQWKLPGLQWRFLVLLVADFAMLVVVTSRWKDNTPLPSLIILWCGRAVLSELRRVCSGSFTC